MPRRRLRSRLSPELADSILYPSDTASLKSQFHDGHDGQPKHASAAFNTIPNGGVDVVENGDMARHSYQFKGNEFGCDDEAVAIRRHQEQRQRPRSTTTASSKNSHILMRNESSKFFKPPIPQSTASSNDSIDGYDSFENTNNKKKRKIPTSGSLGSHQPSLSSEMAHMGLSSTRDIDVSPSEVDSGVEHYHGSGSSAIPVVASGNGLSGAGRGRYGRASLRQHSGRSPLGVSFNGSNTLQATRPSYFRRDLANSGGIGSKGDRIFSVMLLLRSI